jgi:hypothetical protein
VTRDGPSRSLPAAGRRGTHPRRRVPEEAGGRGPQHPPFRKAGKGHGHGRTYAAAPWCAVTPFPPCFRGGHAGPGRQSHGPAGPRALRGGPGGARTRGREREPKRPPNGLGICPRPRVPAEFRDRHGGLTKDPRGKGGLLPRIGEHNVGLADASAACRKRRECDPKRLAGNARPSRRAGTGQPAHPRARGERAGITERTHRRPPVRRTAQAPVSRQTGRLAPGPRMIRAAFVRPGGRSPARTLQVGLEAERLRRFPALLAQFVASLPSLRGDPVRVVGRVLLVPCRPPPHDRAPSTVARRGPRWRVWCGRGGRPRCRRCEWRGAGLAPAAPRRTPKGVLAALHAIR